MSRRGIAAVGLTAALRARFGDGEEHRVADAVAALAHLVPPEIAAREYRHVHKRQSWPPDDYAGALYHGQRGIILEKLRQAGATWGPRPSSKAPVETFRLPNTRDVEPSASTRRERREMARALLERFPSKSDVAIARQCGLSQPTILRIRAGLSYSSEYDRPRRTVERGGVTYEMRVGKQGRPPKDGCSPPTVTVPVTAEGALALLRRLPRADAMRAVNAYVDGSEPMP